MQHFKPDPPKKNFPFRGVLLELLNEPLTDQALMIAISKVSEEYVEAQRIDHLTTYAKSIH